MLCGVLSSIHLVFPTSFVLLCCEWSVDCLLSLRLHIFYGARSWIFDLIGGVPFSRCGCELCLVGVVFDVALRVGVIFLLNLVSPVQLSPSSLCCSSGLEGCVEFSCSQRPRRSRRATLGTDGLPLRAASPMQPRARTQRSGMSPRRRSARPLALAPHASRGSRSWTHRRCSRNQLIREDQPYYAAAGFIKLFPLGQGDYWAHVRIFGFYVCDLLLYGYLSNCNTGSKSRSMGPRYVSYLNDNSLYWEYLYINNEFVFI